MGCGGNIISCRRSATSTIGFGYGRTTGKSCLNIDKTPALQQPSRHWQIRRCNWDFDYCPRVAGEHHDNMNLVTKPILIPLTRNMVALVDVSDFPLVSKFKWHACKCRGIFYAARKMGDNHTTVLMHRQIMGFPDGLVDHRNRNSLDNQRLNLRTCNHSQNGANAHPYRKTGKLSPFKGVRLQKYNGSWGAKITVNYKRISLGTFKFARQAAEAYDAAAVKYFGEFASTNQSLGLL